MTRKYSATQQAKLDMVAAIHEERVLAKATLERRLRAELKDAFNDLELKESRAANDALDAGVSKSAIGRAMGTTNWETINERLKRTAMDYAPEDFDPLAKRYSIDGDSIRVTLDSAEWTATADWWDIPASVAGAVPGELLSALVSFGGAIDPSALGMHGPFAGRSIEHPVSLWLRDAAHRREFSEWANSQQNEGAGA